MSCLPNRARQTKPTYDRTLDHVPALCCANLRVPLAIKEATCVGVLWIFEYSTVGCFLCLACIRKVSGAHGGRPVDFTEGNVLQLASMFF